MPWCQDSRHLFSTCSTAAPWLTPHARGAGLLPGVSLVSLETRSDLKELPLSLSWSDHVSLRPLKSVC